jgi:hypothetical protein
MLLNIFVLSLTKELARIEEGMAEYIQSKFPDLSDLLNSAKSVGKTTSSTLIAEVPDWASCLAARSARLSAWRQSIATPASCEVGA